MKQHRIVLKKVAVHNLKKVDLTLPPNELIVFSGVSGSGKSSLAFDTLYVEGQRRYVESLSTYARRQLGELARPALESAEGITPTISIEQKSGSRNPRSTVGTLTEIYDYLRVLYARIGEPHCPVSGEAVTPQSRERIIRTAQTYPNGTKIIILASLAKGKKGEFKEELLDLTRKGFTRVRVDGTIRHLEENIALDRNLVHDVDLVIDRIEVSPENGPRIAESVTSALQWGNGVMSILSVDSKEETLFSMHAYSQKSGLSYKALEPHDFSFNSPHGMCPECQGLGIVQEFDLNKVIDPKKSIAEDCFSIGSSYTTVRYGNIYDNLARLYRFSVHTPWKKLSEEAKKVFLYGTEKKWTRMDFVHPITGATWSDHVQWRGVLHEAKTRFTEATSDIYRNKMLKNMREGVCPACHGERLKPYPRMTLVGKKRIGELTRLTIEENLRFFDQLKLSPNENKIASELLKEIRSRLKFLLNVGLNYLTLDRTAPTLSGGEAQRVRLASQIGCGLVGITYILDEPSIGLHPRDNKKLIETLKTLRDIGNTVIVVEHDEETLLAADRIVDFGPGAGSQGGEVLVNGSLKDLLKEPKSLTGAYLSGRREIAIPKTRRKKDKKALTVVGASHHNLKNLSVTFPLGLFIAVTGVSGSGKSSLVTDIVYPALSNHLHRAELNVGNHEKIEGIEQLDKVISIDQSPIGRNPRSNPATYIKLLDDIRSLFAELPESKARGYTPGRFSFNVKEGSCTECHGMGMIKIDMDFLEEEWVECPLCENKRFDKETLSVLYKGKNIYDVLEMDVAEALKFFEPIPAIRKKLEMLHRVGLDYLKIGQPSTTLSGGEAQRIKLAKELVRPASGNTIYILDEPSTGLHFHDIAQLLKVLHEFVEQGNTVLVIEHNMDIVKTADWIIDLGPEGGEGGGELIAEGTPEKIAKMKTPTGTALHEVLTLTPQERLKNFGKEEPTQVEQIETIAIEDAEHNNLKRISVTIPREKMTVCTGPSGSGKSSFAFDTVYAEGQRRYIESLSPYARQFVKQMPKPKVGHIEGLSPAIAIEQKSHAGNPRSTVGTMTEVYDYLRILYARLGIAHSPETGKVIKSITKDYVADQVLLLPQGTKIHILAPIQIKKTDKFDEIISRLQKQGYVRVRLNGVYYDIDQPIDYDRKRKNALYLVVDRLKVDSSIRLRLLEAIENGANFGKNQLTIAAVTDDGEKDYFYNLAFADESTGKSYPPLTPHSFAFNKAEGMCLECAGLGITYGANLAYKEWILELPLVELLPKWIDLENSHHFFHLLLKSFEKMGIDPYVPLKMISAKGLQYVFNGSTQPIDLGSGLKVRYKGLNEGIALIGKAGNPEWKELVLPLLEENICAACEGDRLNPLARHVTLEGYTLGNLSRLPVNQTLKVIEKIPLKKEHIVLDEVKEQIISRLEFLCDVGIHYISLDRRSPTLSGGEAQRIRLASQLGSGLTGVLYVLDEPTIGLHPKDNHRLNKTLQKLKELGNTLLLVEHDPLTVKSADYVLDFGPGAGIHGGHLTAQGTYKEILKNPNSLTGAYLSGKKKISVHPKRAIWKKGALSVKHAKAHNLKDISCEIPLSCMTCFTGVSGSGKSTLLHDVIETSVQKGLLKENKVKEGATEVSGIDAFERLISIDQNPIGQTVRSDVCTYVDLLTLIRQFYAQLPLAKTKGLQPKNFSYNHLKGMCTHCWGLGFKKIDLHFLPSLRIECEECHGLRLNPVSLEVSYQGKNVGQLLQSTVDEMRIFFENHPKICRVLDTLIAVGLGYLKLGQEMNSLSGGEAQRIKLSRELSKRSRGKTLYLLDEPTTGLHSEDIEKLLKVLHTLVDKGNTMIIIEHNVDMIRNADYILDLGPGGGDEGGMIVAEGTPEELTKNNDSVTGPYLK